METTSFLFSAVIDFVRERKSSVKGALIGTLLQLFVGEYLLSSHISPANISKFSIGSPCTNPPCYPISVCFTILVTNTSEFLCIFPSFMSDEAKYLHIIVFTST